MNTVQEQLDSIRHQGAMAFAGTDLANGHRAVTRRVRRDRTVRAGVATLAGVGVVGTGTFGALQLRGADALVPMGIAAPAETDGASPSSSASPVPTASAPAARYTSVQVEEGMTAAAVVTLVADTWGLSEQTAVQTLRAALPEEANGELEGWLPAGTWPTDDFSTPEQLAEAMVAVTTSTLENAGVDREQWQEVITIASIVQAEADDPEDFAGVAAVIHNRIDMDMRLDLDSTVRYALGDVDGEEPFTSGDEREVDSLYNTYVHLGLPPGPIGMPSLDAIQAAANPADEDWLFFVTVNLDTGETRFSNTLEEHTKNVQLLQEWVQANS